MTSKISLPKTWVEEIKKRYGTAEQIMTVFNPSRQSEFARYSDRCMTGEAPSLTRFSIAYGSKPAVSWLAIQLAAVGEYAGNKEKQSIEQLAETAEVLLTEYGYLKLTEFMLFFHKLKAGHYGSFYGAVDGIKIGEAMLEFIKWRRCELCRIDREAEQRRRAEAEERDKKNCISYETYKIMKEYEAGWLLNMGY